MPKRNKEANSEGTVSIEGRLSELEEARNKALEENGYKEFLTIPEGETVLEVDDSVALRTSKYGRTIARVRCSGIEYDWSISPALEYEILKALSNDLKTFTIVRVGKGRDDTRYSLKSVS